MRRGLQSRVSTALGLGQCIRFPLILRTITTPLIFTSSASTLILAMPLNIIAAVPTSALSSA